MKKRIDEITENTPFVDILRAHPKVVKKVLKSLNLPCLECSGIGRENIRQIAVTNGLDTVDFLNRIKSELSAD